MNIDFNITVTIAIALVIVGGLTIRFVLLKNKQVQKSRGENSPNIIGDGNNVSK